VRWVIFVVDGATNSAVSGEMQAIDAFNDDLRRNGEFVIAVGIGAPDTAHRFDLRSTDPLSAPAPAEYRGVAGSLQSAEEFYSGFWVIDAVDREAAERLAARASRACNRKVELRPLLG
jgi:hypothetical protein